MALTKTLSVLFPLFLNARMLWINGPLQLSDVRNLNSIVRVEEFNPFISTHQSWSRSPQPHTLDVAVVPGVEVVSYASNPSTREIKAEGSESEDYPVRHGEIVASMVYMRVDFK